MGRSEEGGGGGERRTREVKAHDEDTLAEWAHGGQTRRRRRGRVKGARGRWALVVDWRLWLLGWCHKKTLLEETERAKGARCRCWLEGLGGRLGCGLGLLGSALGRGSNPQARLGVVRPGPRTPISGHAGTYTPNVRRQAFSWLFSPSCLSWLLLVALGSSACL